MNILRQGTAATIILGTATDAEGDDVVNTLTDSTPDGTVSTSAVTGCTLYKNGTAVSYSPTVAQAGLGQIAVSLTTAMVDTIGRLDVVIVDDAAGVFAATYTVLHANVYDYFVGSAAPVTSLSAVTASVDAVQADVDTLSSAVSDIAADVNTLITAVSALTAALEVVTDAIALGNNTATVAASDGTTTAFTVSGLEQSDSYIGMQAVFTSGDNLKTRKQISGQSSIGGSNVRLTVSSPFGAAPALNDTLTVI